MAVLYTTDWPCRQRSPREPRYQVQQAEEERQVVSRNGGQKERLQEMWLRILQVMGVYSNTKSLFCLGPS